MHLKVGLIAAQYFWCLKWCFLVMFLFIILTTTAILLSVSLIKIHLGITINKCYTLYFRKKSWHIIFLVRFMSSYLIEKIINFFDKKSCYSTYIIKYNCKSWNCFKKKCLLKIMKNLKEFQETIINKKLKFSIKTLNKNINMPDYYRNLIYLKFYFEKITWWLQKLKIKTNMRKFRINKLYF